MKLALAHNLALDSVHLPLDLHPKIGNNVLLAAALGFEKTEPFLEMKGEPIGPAGWKPRWRRDELITRLEESLGGPVRCVGTGPMESRVYWHRDWRRLRRDLRRVAVEGIDTYITGEAPHWAAVAAEELGVNLFLGGHYATETSGSRRSPQSWQRNSRCRGNLSIIPPAYEGFSLGAFVTARAFSFSILLRR